MYVYVHRGEEILPLDPRGSPERARSSHSYLPSWRAHIINGDAGRPLPRYEQESTALVMLPEADKRALEATEEVMSAGYAKTTPTHVFAASMVNQAVGHG